MLPDGAASVPAGAAAVPRDETKLPSLDALRGVAVLMVLGFHTLRLPEAWPGAAHLNRALHSGWLGVDLFFVLSGFLITRILIRTRDAENRLTVFYARRSLRILPLAYAALALLLGASYLSVDAVTGGPLEQGWATMATYTFNWWISAHERWPANSVLNHFWSLCVEEQFYLLWPWVIFLLPRRALPAATTLALAASWLLKWHADRSGVPTPTLMTHTVTRADCLLLGAVVAALLSRFGEERVARWARWSLVPVGAALALEWVRRGGFSLGSESIVYDSPLFGAAAAAIVALLVQGDAQARSRTGPTAVLGWFGKYSYGIYVYHWLVYWSFVRQGWRELAMVTSALTLLTTLALALASYHFFEAPILARKPGYRWAGSSRRSVEAR